ncbi:hypothetical protein E2C01_096048 [Portunus trituberculatus]|uniref:Uncharacterized protein n=1 Tax=Portunus trituberculatus TaxID=210409 RepID=A0A5B7K208_PORTR|nr:hypothetical protein [Portunus trituberculatus]
MFPSSSSTACILDLAPDPASGLSSKNSFTCGSGRGVKDVLRKGKESV